MSAVETRSLGALGRMGVVAGFHVALILVLANSLGLVPKTQLPPDIQYVPVEQPQPPPEKPVPVDYKPDTNPPIVLPAPDDVPVDAQNEEGAISAELRPVEKIPIETGTAVVEPKITRVTLDARHPLSQPPYPPAMQRQGIEAAVDVEVFVQPNGRVSDARIAKTSGYEDFDRVTLIEARGWRLAPATRDGQPFPQWYRLRVVFKLKNQ